MNYKIIVGFQVLIAVTLKNIFWDVSPYSAVNNLHLPNRKINQAISKKQVNGV
jgi:hypothetical protein